MLRDRPKRDAQAPMDLTCSIGAVVAWMATDSTLRATSLLTVTGFQVILGLLEWAGIGGRSAGLCALAGCLVSNTRASLEVSAEQAGAQAIHSPALGCSFCTAWEAWKSFSRDVKPGLAPLTYYSFPSSWRGCRVTLLPCVWACCLGEMWP